MQNSVPATSQSLENIAQHTEHMRKIHVSKMSENCRFCIAIPCYYAEGKIQETLEKYKKLIKKDQPGRFEVTVLLNGPTDGHIDESEAKKQIEDFVSKNPDFPLNVYAVTVPFQVKGKIGRLRGILTKINADRCFESSISVDNFIHITHDADLVDIDSTYLDAIDKYFSENPNIQIAGGHVEYPEWFKGKYYLGFILQRIEDALGIVSSYKNSTSVKSGNAIYRLGNLLSNPFKDAKKGEASLVVNATKRKFADLGIGHRDVIAHPNSHIIPPIISDPRRIVLSIGENDGGNFSRRHTKFAQEGDLMFQYNKTIDNEEVIDDAVPYTNVISKEQIEKGIQGLLLGRLTHVMRSTTLREDERMFHTNNMRKSFKRAVFLSTGMKIEIDNDNNVVITDMKLLQESLLNKFGPLHYKRGA